MYKLHWIVVFKDLKHVSQSHIFVTINFFINSPFSLKLLDVSLTTKNTYKNHSLATKSTHRCSIAHINWTKTTNRCIFILFSARLSLIYLQHTNMTSNRHWIHCSQSPCEPNPPAVHSVLNRLACSNNASNPGQVLLSNDVSSQEQLLLVPLWYRPAVM